MDTGVVVVAMTAITFGIASPLMLVAAILWYKLKKTERLHEIALKLAENGQTVPPELFISPETPYSDFRRGVVLLTLGVALSLALSQIGAPWAFGLIPLFMGFGYLLVWKMEGSRHGGSTRS
jgi:Domain of unknown function (DUF6249)